ncbi:hypothetical protein BDW68DRAFT_155261 [Aspergillus falconensis]
MFELAIRLLELGADVAAPGGGTAIDVAAGTGLVSMVQLLLEAYKGDENVSDVCRRATGCADKAGQIVIAEWLREYSPSATRST